MALSKVPDSALEKLRCSCGRYLSSAPIIVCQDGQNMCSKCVDVQTPHLGALTQNLAYEALAEFFKFPCCYKHKGCTQYVEFNKAAEHEDECRYRVYDCPVNLLSSCDKRGTATELCQHYERDHTELYLKYPTFKVDVTADFELHHLFKVDDVVFLLQTKCSTTAGKLWFNAIYFGNTLNASLIRYNIKLNNADDKKRVMELEQEKPCCINNILMLPAQFVELDISIAMGFLNNSKLQCHWVVHVPEGLSDKIKNQQKLELEEIFETKKESICCRYCGISMVPPIYRCTQNHVTCIDCQGYDNQCRSCFKNHVRFTVADDLEMISKSGSHRCKWRSCNREFPYDAIRSHEQDCFYRVYKCPECNWSGIYDMFLNHFKCDHRTVQTHLTDSFALSLQNFSSYIIAHREIFKFVVNREFGFGSQASACDISVCFLGSVTYADYWKYEVKDNFGTVYSFRGDQYTGALRISNVSEGQLNWNFGNVYVGNTKIYTFYIVKK